MALSQSNTQNPSVGMALQMAKAQRAAGTGTDKVHTGPITSAVAGRTDHMNMQVPNESYVIPADVVSGIGEGNTLAGFAILNQVLGLDLQPEEESEHTGQVGIIAAGGEYVIKPQDVRSIGGGDYDRGHKEISRAVLLLRRDNIRDLRKLPPPEK